MSSAKKPKNIPLSRMFKYAERHYHDTDAVLDAWNKDPEKLRADYLKALTAPPSGDLDEEISFEAHPDSLKSRYDKHIEKQKRPDFKNMQNILEKLRQEVKHKKTKEGLEVTVRISSQYSPDALEETLIFPPDTKIRSKPIEMIIDQTVSALSYEYLLGL